MKLTFPKVGTWSLQGLSKTQSLIARAKTSHIEVFFIPLERSWSVDVQNGHIWAIWTSAAQAMGKEGLEIKLTIWLPSTKIRVSTQIQCQQVQCNMALKSSQRELQDCFRPHPNRRFEQEAMDAQSYGVQTGTVSGLHFGSPGKKWHLDVVRWSNADNTIWGKVVASPSLGCGESSESVLPVICPNTNGVSECELTNLWLVCDAGLCN
jgi:hypothetical protein